MTLSDDEIRERFSAFHDGELSGDELAAVRSRIAESPTLAEEYDKFKALMSGLAGLALNDDPASVAAPAAAVTSEAPINILPALQTQIHKRSGGKFYRSNASRLVGTRPYELMAAATLVVLLITYVLLTYVSGLKPAEPHAMPNGPQAPARR